MAVSLDGMGSSKPHGPKWLPLEPDSPHLAELTFSADGNPSRREMNLQMTKGDKLLVFVDGTDTTIPPSCELREL